MSALGIKLALIAILFASGAAGGGYLMWGQVQDARAVAKQASERADDLGKQLDDLAKRQADTDALLAVRKRKDNELTAQLTKLRSDLNGALKDEPAWSADCVPSAVADRLRLPLDPDCPRPSP